MLSWSKRSQELMALGNLTSYEENLGPALCGMLVSWRVSQCRGVCPGPGEGEVSMHSVKYL